MESSLNAALRQFEAVEANLTKAEKLMAKIDEKIPSGPSGIAFGEDPEYEKDRRHFDRLYETLPPIDGWKPNVEVPDLNWIAQSSSPWQKSTKYFTGKSMF